MAGNDALRDWLASSHPDVEGGTPIENMMFRALSLLQAKYMNRLLNRWPIIGVQHEVGPYRADFALFGSEIEVIIECDGHAFHEKTKEQAAKDKARDRFLAESGYRVLRFTGSEIWANPFACAAQAMRIATGSDLGDEL